MHFLKNHPFVIALILLAGAGLVFAGAQARIQGQVTDTDGTPIANAEVTITTSELTSFHKVLTTDKKGKFKLLLLDATRHYLFHVEAAGYQAQERPFKVAAGSTENNFEFQLVNLEQAAAQGAQALLEQPGYKELNEGRNLYEAGDKEGAKAKFQEAVTAMPDLLPALASLAEVNYETGDFEAALDIATKCLEQDDEAIECLAVAANSAQRVGDEEARAGFMARYKELNPEDPTILYNSAAEFLNKLDDAVSYTHLTLPTN